MKIRKAIALTVIYTLLFTHMSLAQSINNITLPDILVFFESGNNTLTPDILPRGFRKIDNSDNALIRLKVVQTYAHKNYSHLINYGCATLGYSLFYSLAAKDTKGDRIKFGVLGGLTFAFYRFMYTHNNPRFDENKYITTKFYTSIYEVNRNGGLTLLKKLVVSKKGSGTFYNIDNQLTEILHNKYEKFSKLVDLFLNYSSPLNNRSTDKWKSERMASLGSPKKEFETTMLYKERIRREALMRRTIETEYQQKLAYSKEKYDIQQLKKKT